MRIFCLLNFCSDTAVKNFSRFLSSFFSMREKSCDLPSVILILKSKLPLGPVSVLLFRSKTISETLSYMKMSAGLSRNTKQSSSRYSEPWFAPIEHLMYG